MAEARRSALAFMGPPSRMRMAAADAHMVASARAVRWRDGDAPPPHLRVGGDPSRTRLRMDPTTAPGDHIVVLELADGEQREVTVSVEARPRLRVAPSELRFGGPPGAAVSARLLLENRGNVDITIDEALVTGVFDDDGIETALASTYRMETDDLNKIVGNVFARLREAHGGLLRLRVSEGAGTLARGERRVVVLQTTLGSKLRKGHGYHGVLDIGEHGIAVHVQVEGDRTNDNEGGVA